MIKTDDAAFTAAMRAAVAEHGEDYVFPEEWKDSVGQCTYVQPDGHGPACLIGVALYRLGVPLQVLLDHEYTNADVAISAVASGVTHAVGRAAVCAQMVQDDGVTWGEALDAYLGELRRLERRS